MQRILQKHTSMIFSIFILQTYQTVVLFFNEYYLFDIFFHFTLFQRKCKQDVVLSLTNKIFKVKLELRPCQNQLAVKILGQVRLETVTPLENELLPKTRLG